MGNLIPGLFSVVSLL